MYKILFVCHGNICRSPMAEYIMRDMLEKRGLTGVETASAATSTEEIGNGVHEGTARILRRLGIDCSGKTARQLTRADGERFDLLIGMDGRNIANIRRITGQSDKIRLLPEYAGLSRDISDPWYTGDFEQTLEDVSRGCAGLLEELIRTGAAGERS